MKTTVACLLLSLFCACRALDCYNCVYIEDDCGKDCKKGGYVVTGLTTSNFEGAAGANCMANRALEVKSALNISNVSVSGSGTQATTYPYCLKATTKLNGKDVTIRTYGWFASTNLDGTTGNNVGFTIIGQPTIYPEVHYCNGNKCNGSTSLQVGVPAFTTVVILILVKFVQL